MICDVTRHGAIAGDGASDDAAIAAAIDRCAGHGGQVRVPAGVFLSGGIALKSHMELHLAPGASLRGAPNLADYRTLPTGDQERSRGLVSGIGVTDVTITGSGTLDGAGTPFHATPNARPHFTLGLFDCSGVRVSGITLIDPAKYQVTTNRCSNVTLDGVTILSDMLAPNADGIQVRDSSDVTITNCRIETGDDAIVLKSSARWVERVRVSGCRLVSDDAAFKFGTGSEPGIRDVVVEDTIITGSRYGIALFMQDGGIYERAVFRNLTIETGGRHAREYPVFIDIDTRQPDSAAGWGRVRDIAFEQVQIATRGNILIQGQPGHDVEGLSFSDVTMRVASAVDVTQINGKPRGNRAHAPRTGAADYSNLAGHFVLGHVDGLGLANVVTQAATPGDARAPLVLRDVRGVTGTVYTHDGSPQ
ncbi:MAG: glycosyl hydrolase family 28 protein [Hyphomonadaceae bacterium]|nr:glycosyl hydrolase family 28 protein [Hyphomonadaceae bacterium]